MMVFTVHDRENLTMIRPLERGPDGSVGKTDPSFAGYGVVIYFLLDGFVISFSLADF